MINYPVVYHPPFSKKDLTKGEPSQASLLEDSKYEFLTESSYRLPNVQVNFCAINKDYILILSRNTD